MGYSCGPQERIMVKAKIGQARGLSLKKLADRSMWELGNRKPACQGLGDRPRMLWTQVSQMVSKRARRSVSYFGEHVRSS